MTEQLELYIANRKVNYHKHTREDTLQIGDHVHLRNRVKGPNKFVDAWDLIVSEQIELTCSYPRGDIRNASLIVKTCGFVFLRQ